MKSYFALGLLLFAACPLARSQAAPAATSGSADLRYALRYSENAQFGEALETWHTIDASGSLDYLNGRTHAPFTLDYTGGHSFTISGPSYSTGVFHRLSLSQGFGWRRWFLTLSDDVGYRPQAPITGFSGIPGTGEPIGGGSNSPSSQLIFTLDTSTLDNTTSGELQHIFSHALEFNVSANHSMLRYPGGNGLDTDGLMIGAGPTVRFDARNSLTAHYAFSRFSYPDHDTGLETDAVTLEYEKTWNRAVRTSASVGPQWIRTSALFPGSTDVVAQAWLDYQSRDWSGALAYSRGISGGSGYMMGAESDSLTASLSHTFARKFTFETSGGYRHMSELAQEGNIGGEFGSAQASWHIGRHLNAFANYTAMSQSSSAQVPANVLTQFMQSVSFGIGFSKETKAVR